MMKRNRFFIEGIVLLLSVSICAAQAAGEVIAERVIPDKVLYKLDEDARATVWLKNTGKETVSGRLVAREFRGVDSSRQVAAVPVTLAAGQVKRDISFSWNVGPWKYGRELRVDFVAGGKTLSSASEFFQVADLWLRTNIIAGWKPGEGLPQDLGPFETYANHAMHYGWAPCDFSDLTPDTDNWFSGMAFYPKSKERLKAAIKNGQKVGIKMSMYARHTFCGPAGFEFARRHPEWVIREKDGSFDNYRGGGPGNLSPVDLAKPTTHRQPFWQYGLADLFSTADSVEFGAREMVASVKMFGWDGVMFDDGQFLLNGGSSWDGHLWDLWPGGKNEEPSVRIARLWRHIVRKQFPNFTFWYNGTYIRFNPTLVVCTLGGPKTMEAALDDPNSGMLVEQQGVGFVKGPWRSHYDGYTNRPGYSEVVERFSTPINSGWLWNYDLSRSLTEEEIKASREAWVAASHMGSIFLACNLHPCWNTTYASRPFTQFMTRYSALLWDTDVKKIEAETFFNVESERELWWKKAAYVKRNEGETLYLLHLLNTPTTEKPVWKIPDDPPAASGVEVIFKVPEGKVVEKAWALRPYEWGEEDRTPVRVELEMETMTAGVKVKLPPFHYYTLVVLKLKK